MTVKTVAQQLTTPVPQSQPIPGREADMHRNLAGGYVFTVDDWTRLNRWLILGGGDSGTYYASAKDVTLDNAKVVERCLAADGLRTVKAIVDISVAGRAPRNDAAIVALALAAKRGDDPTKRAAYAAVPEVCRIGTHLFAFAEMIQALGGWGQGARKAVGRWYSEKPTDKLAYQLVKYRARDGWSNRDLLRLVRPTPADATANALFNWTTKPQRSPDHYRPFDAVPLPRIIEGFEKAQHAETPAQSAALIAEYRLPRECIRPEHLDSKEVWAALLTDMPLTAMIRNLGNMSKVGLLTPLSDAASTVIATLADIDGLRRARIHPMALLLAQRVYQSGHGFRGKGTWSPVQQVVDALDAAFYGSMGNAHTTGKRILLGVDVSGSMQSPVSGYPLSAFEAAAAFALIIAMTEPNHYILGFSDQAQELKISPRMRLGEALDVVMRADHGGTDCAIPMQWAAREKISFDTIAVLTDSETWYGRTHPATALQHYRAAQNFHCRSATLAFTATRSSLGDQRDPLNLEVVGLDANVPNILSSFMAEEF